MMEIERQQNDSLVNGCSVCGLSEYGCGGNRPAPRNGDAHVPQNWSSFAGAPEWSFVSPTLVLLRLQQPFHAAVTTLQPLHAVCSRYNVPSCDGPGGRHVGGWTHANRKHIPTVRQTVNCVRHPELKVSTPAHKKHLDWYLEFEFRVTHLCQNHRADRPHVGQVHLHAPV